MRWEPTSEALAKVRLFAMPTQARRFAIGNDDVPLSEVRNVAQLGPTFITLQVASWGQIGLKFEEDTSATLLFDELSKCKSDYERFEQFEQGSVQSYFQYYGKLANQQNMLQDSVRTSTYRRAIVENPDDFRGLIAMDIGAGSGILSFFAAQAGASRVYAVEASSAAEVIKALAAGNAHNLSGTAFEVLNKPLENIRDDEVCGKVDVLVSEPIGTFLFNERMIETYLCARDRFLKPGGKMFPNVGDLCIAPFSDATVHFEQQNKNGFWKNNSFYGVDLTAALPRCAKEQSRQPIVDYIDPNFLVSKHQSVRFDFATCTVESLQHIEIPFDFEINQPCLVHGIAGWFDALFQGSNQEVLLSTAPWCPGTHWYQIRFLLETPLAINAGQHLEGKLTMQANNLQSYYVSIVAKIAGTNVTSEATCIDLKDPEYRFYTSPSAYCPPGTASVYGQQQQQPQPPVGGAPAVQQAQAMVQQAQAQQTQHSSQEQFPPQATADYWQSAGWTVASSTSNGTEAHDQPLVNGHRESRSRSAGKRSRHVSAEPKQQRG